MPKLLIVGNWKMNGSLRKARDLIEQLVAGAAELHLDSSRVEVVVCPPFVHLFPAQKAVADTPLALGAQNVYCVARGAFTGEISTEMIAETGARYVIIGHSERRHTIGRGEDDWLINRKVAAALAGGLRPILCVGETLAQRKASETLAVLSFQLRSGLCGVDARLAPSLVVAYEPVWAIGTGENATPEQAQEAHGHLRAGLREMFEDAADQIPILYGGSVNAANAEAILGQSEVNGALVGGASLAANDFLAIIRGGLAAKAG